LLDTDARIRNIDMATEPATTVRYHPEGTLDVPEEHSATEHVSLATYLIVFAALMILLVLTVVASFYVNLGGANILVALFIAIIKAALVVLYFMHVKYASRLTKVFVSAAFLWLAILFALTFSDYLTRRYLPMSRGWVDKDVPVERGAGH
jgi:cytochrome c oxidase subunit 4